MADQQTTSLPEPATTPADAADTGVGSVFVSNYPPYSFWSADRVPDALNVLDTPAPATDVPPLGLYLHIPFCRKRCKFCYFRVYTDKNSGEIGTYLDALAREVALYAAAPRIAGRPLRFVYFGGGTPSYISARRLQALARRLRRAIPWDAAEEITFECEPGTLTQSKLDAVRDIGVTRLSLGIENLDDAVLKENGRAHLSREVRAVVPWIRARNFDQWNADLIAGMVGETWPTWRDTVRRTIDLDPDGITVYQMELPFNTVYSRGLLDGDPAAPAVPGWDLKREWHAYAVEQCTAAGYETASAYTLVKKGTRAGFVYRDALWRGADMMGAGVASISHVGGVHSQNTPEWNDYVSALQAGRLPLQRAFVATPRERLIREMILQLKLGRIDPGYFAEKFDADVLQQFGPAWRTLRDQGMLTFDHRAVALTPEGLLRVDRLLPTFYDAQYRNARYT